MFLLKCLQNAGNAVLDTQNSKFSRGGIPPNPPSRLVPSALERFDPPKINPAGATVTQLGNSSIPKCMHGYEMLRSTHGHGLLIGLHRNTIQRCDGAKLLIIFIHVFSKKDSTDTFSLTRSF